MPTYTPNRKHLQALQKSPLIQGAIKLLGFVLLFVLCGWVYVFVKRSIQSQATKDLENELDNQEAINNAENLSSDPVKQQTKEETLRKRWKNIPLSKFREAVAGAHAIAKAFKSDPSNNYKGNIFGLAWLPKYDLFNISAIGEDEQTAVMWLKKFPGSFQLLEECYYYLATLSRPLKSDCYRWLSKGNLDAVRANHLKAGNYKNL